MGSNTLNTRASGEIITDAFFNDFNTALEGDFLGRNSSGVPTAGQNLGSAAIPWGSLRATSLIINGSSVDVSQISAPPYRVISGKKRTTSNQPAFITPNGSAASFIVAGATTNLIFDVNGSSYTLTSNLTETGVTTAPSSNNTCLVNDSTAADQESTRTWGEYGAEKVITVDTMGSEISGLVGTWQAFKINDGSNDEYFMAYVESSTVLSHAFRGFFYNSSLAPVNRIKFANNDTITLLKAGWVFLDSDLATVDVTYRAPTYAVSSPSSPATGDYWYDMGNALWKRYDGASFATVTRTLIGIVASDSSNTVAARCVDFDAAFSSENNIRTVLKTTEIVEANDYFSSVNVAGNKIFYGSTRPDWNITTDLATSADMYNATEQASTYYYVYVKDTGDTVISDISPYWRPDLMGWYHPHNPWRSVGAFYNDGSSNITDGEQLTALRSEVVVQAGNGHGGTNTKIRRFTTTAIAVGNSITYADSAANGASFTINETAMYFIAYRDRRSGGGTEYGASVNSSQLTTDISGITFADRLFIADTGTLANSGNMPGVVCFLKKGDVVRPHTNGNPDGGDDETFFFIRQVSYYKRGYN